MQFYKFRGYAPIYLTPKSPLHPAGRGRHTAVKSPLHRMETYTQHTRDYRGEVNSATLPRSINKSKSIDTPLYHISSDWLRAYWGRGADRAVIGSSSTAGGW
jgi:hypothetical protein